MMAAKARINRKMLLSNPNMAINLAPFGRWTGKSCAFPRRLFIR